MECRRLARKILSCRLDPVTLTAQLVERIRIRPVLSGASRAPTFLCTWATSDGGGVQKSTVPATDNRLALMSPFSVLSDS